jgi:alkanesulfonate monooxygenase SsuD/methylene tetrahydromethanopterin reductase-like flavin-dependent oxidoreductase (luciferase family)
MMAAGGPVATKMAARISDGLIATRPDGEQVSKFKEASGGSKPAYGKITVAWAESDEAAQELAVTQWPNAAMGDYSLDIRTPEDFGDIAKLVRAEDMEGEVLCSIDPAQYHEAVRQYFDAGFDLVFVHQVGPDQEGFIRFFEREVMPRFDRVPQTAVR